MLRLTSEALLASIEDAAIRALLQVRMEAIGDGEPYDPEFHGDMLVVQDGDTLADLIAAGVPVHPAPSEGKASGLHFDPPYELLEAHGHFFDMLFVLNDGSLQLTLIVPTGLTGCAALLDHCEAFAVPAAEADVDV